MSDDRPDQATDRLPLGGPYDPDGVAEAARTIAELVRRLNHATLHSSALRYPAHVYRALDALRVALPGLQQTFHQIATRLDAFAADPRVAHDAGGDPRAACTEAAQQLRHAADALAQVTGPLTTAASATCQLGYDAKRHRTFNPPARLDVHKGQKPPGHGVERPAPARPRRAR